MIADGARAIVEGVLMNTLAATLPRSPGLQSALDHVDRFLKEAQARGIVKPDDRAPAPVIQLVKQEDGSYK